MQHPKPIITKKQDQHHELDITPLESTVGKRKETTHSKAFSNSSKSLKRNSLGMTKLETGLYHEAIQHKISGVLTLELRD